MRLIGVGWHVWIDPWRHNIVYDIESSQSGLTYTPFVSGGSDGLNSQELTCGDIYVGLAYEVFTLFFLNLYHLV